MTISEAISWSTPNIHSSRHEGIGLGLTLATVTWLWVAVIDALAGRPFHTFHALGGVLAFTVIHCALNVLLGIVVVSVVHGAERVPSLILGLVFCAIIFQMAVTMLINLLAAAFVGDVAWIGLFGGSLLSTAVAIVLLARGHPLIDYVHRAENER
jgi:hypothetical protein